MDLRREMALEAISLSREKGTQQLEKKFTGSDWDHTTAPSMQQCSSVWPVEGMHIICDLGATAPHSHDFTLMDAGGVVGREVSIPLPSHGSCCRDPSQAMPLANKFMMALRESCYAECAPVEVHTVQVTPKGKFVIRDDDVFTSDFSWTVKRQFKPLERQDIRLVEPREHCQGIAYVVDTFAEEIYQGTHHTRMETCSKTIKTRMYAELHALRNMILFGREIEKIINLRGAAQLHLEIAGEFLDVVAEVNRTEFMETIEPTEIFQDRNNIKRELISHVLNRRKKRTIRPVSPLVLRTEMGIYPDLILRKDIVNMYRESDADMTLRYIDGITVVLALKDLSDEQVISALIANEMLLNVARSLFFDELGLEKLLNVSQEEAENLAKPLTPDDLEIGFSFLSPTKGELLWRRQANSVTYTKHEFKVSKRFDEILSFAEEDWTLLNTSRYAGDIVTCLSNFGDDVMHCLSNHGGLVGEISPQTVEAIFLFMVISDALFKRIHREDKIEYWCSDGTSVSLGPEGLKIKVDGDNYRRPRFDPTAWRSADDVVLYFLSAALGPEQDPDYDDTKSGWDRVRNFMRFGNKRMLLNEVIHSLHLSEIFLSGIGVENTSCCSLHLLSKCAGGRGYNNMRYQEEKLILDKAVSMNPVPAQRRRGLRAPHLGASVQYVSEGNGLEVVDAILLKPQTRSMHYECVGDIVLHFEQEGKKYRSETQGGKLILRKMGLVDQVRSKTKKKKFGFTFLSVGATYEDGGDKEQWESQEAYELLSKFSASNELVRAWLWNAICRGRIRWRPGSCNSMWPSASKIGEGAVSPMFPMPKEVLCRMEAVSNSREVLILPFEGSHFFRLTQGGAGLYRAEEVVDDASVNLNGYKKYSVDAVQGVG